MTDRLRERLLRPVAPLPEGLAVADRASMVGAWVPADPQVLAAGETQVLRLTEAGEVTQTGGCARGATAWSVAPGGRVHTLSSGMPLVGCPSPQLGRWVDDAARAGLDGEVLVLLDADGRETGRLHRAPPR